MIVDIFIRTYSGDLRWLEYCLKSIHKFGTGFRNIIVCIPKEQVKLLEHLTVEKVVTCPIYTNDYIGQQVTKLKAYEYTDAQYILYVDSDCIFTEPFSPSDYIRDGKPIIVKEDFERLKEHKDAYVRKEKLTEDLGFEVKYEYMRRMPLMYLREDVKSVGQQIEELPVNQAGVIITDVLEGMSEFNILGACCERYTNKNYVFLEIGKDDIPPAKAKQFWSWGGILTDIEQEIEYTLSDAVDIDHRNNVSVLLNKMNCKTGAEIGVAYGENAKNILKSGIEKLYLIDMWKKQDEKQYIDGSNNIDFEGAYNFCQGYLADHKHRVEYMRMPSDEAAKSFQPESLDFIYLDGNHHNPQFEKDLNTWYKLLKRGGLFGGHDYYDCDFPYYKCEVRTTVNRFAKEHNLKVKITRQTGDESWWCIKP